MCTFALVVFLLASSPVAYAVPPDPLWIAGIYDEADFDEAVGSFLSVEATFDQPLLFLAGPTDVIGTVGRVDIAAIPAVALSPVHSRAPPIPQRASPISPSTSS